MEINNTFGTIIALILYVLIILLIRWVRKQGKECETKKKKK